MLSLYDKVCIFNEAKCETIIYGQYTKRFTKVHLEIDYTYKVVFSIKVPEFFIKIHGALDTIPSATFYYKDKEHTLKDINLEFPFTACDLNMDRKAAIICTMCKDYSHRLDEWIQYNLAIGFSGIVIFDNGSQSSMKAICDKYKGKVWLVDFPYIPFESQHWLTVQRVAFSIGVNAFRDKCRSIALIDADEFIYIPNMDNMNIEAFLENHKTNICIKSRILTNMNYSDEINNNVLLLATYVGEEMYTKIILNTSCLAEGEFISSPHAHSKQRLLRSSEIMHYHCWMNERYEYNNKMDKVLSLRNFFNKIRDGL
jgi:hypothetical protein